MRKTAGGKIRKKLLAETSDESGFDDATLHQEFLLRLIHTFLHDTQPESSS